MDKQKNILSVSFALALLLLSVAMRSFYPSVDFTADFNGQSSFVGDYSSVSMSSVDFVHSLNFICEDVCCDDNYTVHRHQTLRDKTQVLLFSGNKFLDALFNFSHGAVFFSSDTSPPAV